MIYYFEEIKKIKEDPNKTFMLVILYILPFRIKVIINQDNHFILCGWNDTTKQPQRN